MTARRIGRRPEGDAGVAPIPDRPDVRSHRTGPRGLGAMVVLAVLTASSTGSGGHVVTVVQRDRAFSVPEVAIERGDTIRFTNEDGFLHQLFTHAPDFSFDSDEQKPGADVEIAFPVPGSFQVLCGIHPKMRLQVDVR